MKITIFTTSLVILSLISTAFADEKKTYTKLDAQAALKENSYRWKQTNLAVDDSKAKLEQATGATKPQVTFFSREFAMRANKLLLGLTDGVNPDIIGLGATGVQVAYDIWNKSATARLQAAEANMKLGAALSRQYKNDLTFLMLLRYLNAQQAKKKLEAIELTIKKDSDLHHMAEIKLKTGFGIPLDLTRSEGLLEKDKLKKLEYQVNYLNSLGELMDVVGDLPNDIEIEDFKFKEIPTDKLKLLQTTNQTRPDIEVGEHTITVMQNLKSQAELEESYRISIFGDVSTVGIQVMGLSNGPTGMLGLQLTVPLVTGGLRSGKINEALVRENKATLDQQQKLREVKHEMDSIFQKLELAAQAVKATQKQKDLAEKELGYAEKKIKAGSASNLELISAQTNLATIIDLNIQAVFAYEASKLAFYHAIGNVDAYFEAEKTY